MDTTIRLTKTGNLDDPHAPVFMHQIHPTDVIVGRLCSPITQGESIILVDYTVNGIGGFGYFRTTKVTDIKESDEQKVKHITTRNSLYLIEYLDQQPFD